MSLFDDDYTFQDYTVHPEFDTEIGEPPISDALVGLGYGVTMLVAIFAIVQASGTLHIYGKLEDSQKDTESDFFRTFSYIVISLSSILIIISIIALVYKVGFKGQASIIGRHITNKFSKTGRKIRQGNLDQQLKSFEQPENNENYTTMESHMGKGEVRNLGF
jgi:hypothetical protein